MSNFIEDKVKEFEEKHIEWVNSKIEFLESMPDVDSAIKFEEEQLHIKNFLRQAMKDVAKKERKEMIGIVEDVKHPLIDADKYINVVKNGNSDDMFDFGIKCCKEEIINLINNES